MKRLCYLQSALQILPSPLIHSQQSCSLNKEERQKRFIYSLGLYSQSRQQHANCYIPFSGYQNPIRITVFELLGVVKLSKKKIPKLKVSAILKTFSWKQFPLNNPEQDSEKTSFGLLCHYADLTWSIIIPFILHFHWSKSFKCIILLQSPASIAGIFISILHIPVGTAQAHV